jgi:hypothetical protein
MSEPSRALASTMPPTELAERRGGLRTRGPLTNAERHARLAFAAECARHKDEVISFWFTTMMDKTADMSHRIACSDRLMNRAFGLPMQISSETINENRKQILEVPWLPPSPDDHSKLIEPEPD